MGLDFDPSNAHWSYGGFHNFRIRLAAEIGINLNNMDGFYGNMKWDKIVDPIVPLLNHSDCEGDLSSEICSQVGPRLLELVSDWPPNDYDTWNAIELANSMIECGKNGTTLVFC